MKNKNDCTGTVSAFSILPAVICLQGQDLIKDSDRYCWSHFWV